MERTLGGLGSFRKGERYIQYVRDEVASFLEVN